MMTTKISKLLAALDTARADKSSAQRQLDADTRSLESARQLETATALKLVNARQATEADEAEQVLRLDASIRNGAALIGMQSSLDEGVKLELARATHANKIATLAVEAAAKRHAQTKAAVKAAEGAVVAAVDAIQNDEDIELARQLAHHLDEAVRIGTSLLSNAIADEANGRRQVPPLVAEALGKLDLPLIDRRHIAINLLKGDRAVYAQRVARRAALIAGETIQADDKAA